MKIPTKILQTTLVAIDRQASSPSWYRIEILVNGASYHEMFEVESDGSVVGTFEVLEPRWWAFNILLGHLRRFAQGEPVQLPIDLGDLGDPSLAAQFER